MMHIKEYLKPSLLGMWSIKCFEFSKEIRQQAGFTKHYRATDGGQPAVITVRKYHWNRIERCVCS